MKVAASSLIEDNDAESFLLPCHLSPLPWFPESNFTKTAKEHGFLVASVTVRGLESAYPGQWFGCGFCLYADLKWGTKGIDKAGVKQRSPGLLQSRQSELQHPQPTLDCVNIFSGQAHFSNRTLSPLKVSLAAGISSLNTTQHWLACLESLVFAEIIFTEATSELPCAHDGEF